MRSFRSDLCPGALPRRYPFQYHSPVLRRSEQPEPQSKRPASWRSLHPRLPCEGLSEHQPIPLNLDPDKIQPWFSGRADGAREPFPRQPIAFSHFQSSIPSSQPTDPLCSGSSILNLSLLILERFTSNYY